MLAYIYTCTVQYYKILTRETPRDWLQPGQLILDPG